MKKKTAEHSNSLPKSASPCWTLRVVVTSLLSYFLQIPREASWGWWKGRCWCQWEKEVLQLRLLFPLPKKYQVCLTPQSRSEGKEECAKQLSEGSTAAVNETSTQSCHWASMRQAWIQLTSIPWFKPLWWYKRWRYTTLGVISTLFRHLAYWRHLF